MGIDLSKMKAKLSAVNNRGGGTKKSQFWRPEDGEQTIRILPTPDGDPFKEFYFHYNLGKNAGFLSPKKNFGEEDPLDKFIRQLFDESTEESIKMAKSLMARQRFFSPVIVRGQEDQGVKIWGYGKTVYEQLLNLVLNPEYGDITDPQEGTDLLLSYGKPAGASFPQTKLMPSRKTSAMCKDFQSSPLSSSARRQKTFSECWTSTWQTTPQQRKCLPRQLAMGITPPPPLPRVAETM
jgi:hypothetical protein